MPRTIQVDDATYESLKAYKVGGLTFAQVLQRLMEHQDPAEFHREYLAWQRRVVANLKRSGKVHPL
jgi:predicted CopG family antitoxin